MKEHKALGASISILIGSVIAILAFARGNWQTGLLVAVFSVWGLWVVAILLLPLLRQAHHRRKRRIQLQRRHTEGIAPSAPSRFSNRKEGFPVPTLQKEPTEQILLRHVNYRISSYLRSAYPDIRWEWWNK